MPAAIPIAIAGATMVANNMQQKAAIKNNENQQAAAVGNAQQAAQQAFQRQSQWMQHNPAPFSGGINIARPPGFAPTNTIAGQAPPSPNNIMGMAHNNLAFPNGTPSAPWSDFQHALGQAASGGMQPNPTGQIFHPGMFGSLSQIMQNMFHGSQGAPAPGAPGPTGFAQHIMSNVAQPPQQSPMVNTQPVPAPYGVNH